MITTTERYCVPSPDPIPAGANLFPSIVEISARIVGLSEAVLGVGFVAIISFAWNLP